MGHQYDSLDYNLFKPVIIQSEPQTYYPTKIKYLLRSKEIGKLKRKGMLQIIAEFEPPHVTFGTTQLTTKFRRTFGRFHTMYLRNQTADNAMENNEQYLPH